MRKQLIFAALAGIACLAMASAAPLLQAAVSTRWQVDEVTVEALPQSLAALEAAGVQVKFVLPAQTVAHTVCPPEECVAGPGGAIACNQVACGQVAELATVKIISKAP